MQKASEEKKVKYVGKKHLSDSDHDSDEQEDEYQEPVQVQKKDVKVGRTSVSAEVYGKFNKKENFKPKVVPKTQAQKEKIAMRLNQAFMFSNLDDKEKEIVINAMEEVKFKANEWVIKQGEDGDNLYVVDQGTLKCFKKFSKDDKEPKYLKTYQPGESFGELALLYNAPRAASIQAETASVCFALDRECFNHIVKDAAVKKREKYEEFLVKVDLLQTMDPYERIKIADALKPEVFKAGDLIMKQGETGDKFYFLEEGECVCLKVMKAGEKEKEVMNYKAGDYFGELALLKDEPRAASIKAKTNVKAVALDRESFKRLIGPLDEILKRNMEKYKKFM